MMERTSTQLHGQVLNFLGHYVASQIGYKRGFEMCTDITKAIAVQVENYQMFWGYSARKQ